VPTVTSGVTCRQSGLIQQLLDQRSDGQDAFATRRDPVPLPEPGSSGIPTGYTRVSVERVLLQYTNRVPPAETDNNVIFESLVVANFLELDPVISMLCEWIARSLNGCADTGALQEKFQLVWLPTPPDSPQDGWMEDNPVEGSQEEDNQATYPPGLFSQLETSFWMTHLFPKLSTTMQDMMCATCPEFSPVRQRGTVSRLTAFRSRVLEQQRLPQIKNALKYMGAVKNRADAIAVQWVEARGSTSEETAGWPLPVIIGKELDVQEYFEVCWANQDADANRVFVLSEILEWDMACSQKISECLDKEIPMTVEAHQIAISKILCANTGVNKLIRYLIIQRKETKSLQASIQSVIDRIMLHPASKCSQDEITEILRPFLPEPIRTRGIGGSKRRKTRGRGGDASAGSHEEMQTLARNIRNDLRIFPVSLSQTHISFLSLSFAVFPALSHSRIRSFSTSTLSQSTLPFQIYPCISVLLVASLLFSTMKFCLVRLLNTSLIPPFSLSHARTRTWSLRVWVYQAGCEWRLAISVTPGSDDDDDDCQR